MASWVLCPATIFVVCATIHLHLASSVLAIETFGLEQREVLVDCRRQDYRSFVKCLRRQKRQHCVDYGDDCWIPCITTCERNPDCNTDCCECTKKVAQDSINVLTQITLHNSIQGSTTCCPTCQPPTPCPSTNPPPNATISPVTPTPVTQTPVTSTPVTSTPVTSIPVTPTSVTCPHCPYCIYCPPVFQPVVQVGCMYPYQWLCIYPTRQHQRPRIDCSACAIPYYYYRCDVSCYGAQGGYGVHGAHGGLNGYGPYAAQWNYVTPYPAGYYKK
ncbi:unnamed protein product [Xylocopa violacea]|uniref:Uncharacterized protein n=1 Tax=Xylocopa violacea TaxID=135666 RepID=A0ABP1P573_XYLVO